MTSSKNIIPCSREALDRIVPPSEAIKLLGFGSRVTYWRWRKEGKLPPVVVVEGKVLGHRLSAINEWLDRHTQ